MPKLRVPGYEDVVIEYMPFAIPPRWMDKAACQYGDPELFYPGTGDHGAKRALRFCNVCPVKRKCLDWAVGRDEPYGIWGGLNMRSDEAVALRRAARVKRFKETGVVRIHTTRAMTDADTSLGGYVTGMINALRIDVLALDEKEQKQAS